MLSFEVPTHPSLLRMALQAPAIFQAEQRQRGPSVPTRVIWDSGASISVTNSLDDFVGSFTKAPSSAIELQGIAAGLTVEGWGDIEWAFPDTSGALRLLKVPAYYVPTSRARLLSTTSLLQTYPPETIFMEASQLTLSGSASATRLPIVAPVDVTNNLPTTFAHPYPAAARDFSALAALSVVDVDNTNLSEPAKELLRWHFRLGHLAFRKIQFLLRTGVLAHSQATRRLHTAASKITTPPRCAACQFGKQTSRATPGKTATVVRDRQGILKKDHLLPGQQISVDHFVCRNKGRLFTSRGKTSEDAMYSGGCVFVDHASGYLHVAFQVLLNSHETIDAKDKFELMCRDHGVIPQSYLSDNGTPFTSAGFADKLRTFAQIIQFAGVGAHHHNGVAERAIQTIMSISRTMLMHAAIHWPDLADTALWPMAVAHAAFLYNHVPNPDTGIAPVDIFTRTRWEQRKFHDLHVWGCPVYVLDKTLQDGKKLPRWTPATVETYGLHGTITYSLQHRPFGSQPGLRCHHPCLPRRLR
jgi:hypothetical protein